MKRLVGVLVVLGLCTVPSLASASGCYEHEVQLFSRAAAVDPFGDPIAGPNGELIGAPEQSSRDNCDGALEPLRADVAPGATVLAVADTGHRPRNGLIRLHGSNFGVSFSAQPDDAGTWRSDWIGVGPFDTVLPGDVIVLTLCVEGPNPTTTRCFETFFYA